MFTGIILWRNRLFELAWLIEIYENSRLDPLRALRCAGIRKATTVEWT